MISNSAPAVKVIAASLNYQGTQVFSNLHFKLSAGQWTCILGPSGVGKTSLLRLLAGLTPTASVTGSVQAEDGLPLEGRITYLAQEDLLLPWCSAFENVLIGYRLRGEPLTAALRDQAVALLHRVGLSQAIDKKPAALSGGMRQRVALARTLIENRPIVLMDEPFAAVDAITRMQLQSLAVELLQGRTVLLVTHDPLEALRVGDIIQVMAGLPATLGQPILPAGTVPREPTSPALMELHNTILQQLTAAQGGAEW